MPASSSLRKSANRSSITGKSGKQPGLRELVQQRLLTDVFDNCMNSWAGWSVLVMDDDATRVISSAIGMYDIMERKVMLVEDLFKKRAPFPDRAAIYLLAPSEKSVDKMLEDFAGDKPLYGQAAFIFFLGRCSDRLVNKIKECRPLLKVLKKFAEVNVDFLAKEIRAFHLDMRSSFKSIYGSKRSKVENAIADKLLTVCATLNEYPHIRFPEESRFCQSLAKAFHSRMDTFLRNNADFWYHGDSQHTDRDRATLLLLDRKDDCLSPLIHEFTYQALVNDLLPIDNDLITIDMEASTKDNSAKTVKQDVLLNENDSLWVELRSKHIADVGQILSNRIREMINSDTSQVTHREKGTMTVAEMSKALQALPEYREVMSKLSEHLRLSQMCWEKLKERELVDLSQLEQTLATGKDEDGRSPKLAEMIDRVVEELHTLKDTVLKMRLIMILIVSQGGIKSEFKEKVWRAANLKSSAERVIMKLEIMGIPIVTSDQSVRGFKKLFGGKTLKATGNIDEETEYNSRYVPPLQTILEDLVNNRLSLEEYPSLMPMPEMMSMGSSGTAASARKRDTASARKSGSTTSRWQKATPKENTKPGLFTGGRAIVFYVGGICYSELRVARTVMDRENKEIVVGSTHFTKPKDFLRDMDKLSDSS